MKESSKDFKQATFDMILNELPECIAHFQEAGHSFVLSAPELLEIHKPYLQDIFELQYGSTFDPYDYAECILIKELKDNGITIRPI